MNKKMYLWADIPSEGSIEDERDTLVRYIKNETGLDVSIDVAETPEVLEKSFDILFFDWGGMSLGNSMMEHFCSYIIQSAREHPSRLYVMISTFTKAAMEDALDYIGDEVVELTNILLNKKDVLPYLTSNPEPQNLPLNKPPMKMTLE